MAASGFAASLAVVGGAAYLYVRPIYRTPASIGHVPTALPAAVRSAPVEAVPVPAPTGGSDPAVAPDAAPAASSPGGVGLVPVSLSVPSLRIDATVVPEGLVAPGVHDALAGPAGSLQIPDDPRVLGWWQYGAAAGASTGTVVVAGHVDTEGAGDGVLFDLASAQLGAAVTLQTAAGPVPYRIVARQTYRKSALPASVWATGGPPELVVITCGGAFDPLTHHYADNVVVYAAPVAS